MHTKKLLQSFKFSALILWCVYIIPTLSRGDVKDFLISTEPTPSQFVQQSPQLFPTPDGGFIIAWKDYRLGEISYFAQRFDSCRNPVGNNFHVVGDADMAFLSDGTGMIIGTAIEGDYYAVYGQILSKSNIPYAPFLIDKRLITDWGFKYWVSGIKLVAANDHYIFGFNFGGDISLKKFSRDGRAIFESLPSQRLSEDAMTFSLAVNSNDQYVLLWIKAYSDTSSTGIYATFFTSDDSTLAKDVLIQEYRSIPFIDSIDKTKNKKLHATAISDTGFEFFWADADSMVFKYITYSSSGKALDIVNDIQLPPLFDYGQQVKNFAFTNLRYNVFGSLITFLYYLPIPIIDPERDTTLIGWFNSDGMLLKLSQSENYWFPKIGNHLAQLSPDILGCPVEITNDIFLCRLQNFTWLDSLKVNDDLQGANQISPKAVVVDSQRFFVSWQDAKGYHGRSLDTQGYLLGEEINLDSQELISLPTNKMVIFWKKTISEYRRLCGMTTYNTTTWQEILKDTLIQGNLSSRIHITGLQITDSTFLVMVYEYPFIYLYSYFFNGQKYKETTLNEYARMCPFLLRCNKQSFWVLWDGNAQLYSTELEPLSSIFYLRLYSPPVLYLGNGAFLMLSESTDKMYAKIIDTTGTQLEKFLLVDDSQISNINLMFLDSTHFITLWTKDKQIHARTFNTSGDLVIDSLVIHEDIKAYRDWTNVCVNNDKVLFVWSDTRDWEQGYNIYGSIHELNKITRVPHIKYPLHHNNNIYLTQNYPNPFNSITMICYELPKTSHITLKIYNLLGQEIRTLYNGMKSTGIHQTVWDGKDNYGKEIATGLYFYRLSVVGGQCIQTKKLVLIR